MSHIANRFSCAYRRLWISVANGECEWNPCLDLSLALSVFCVLVSPPDFFKFWIPFK